ncbi:Hypothetical protein NCS54_01500100 [Fusarium falciforme]|uniref:Hypothetical protein n=1 Tax=Fusarium falciforme TaxID=195108 RepID=UPI0023000FCE|nr:Hypothetical protein NCS54_01500100 [Fusarium falciforme]WAO97279.1 Hypothetical protein NCS54_01500100 [Fusarium falciforme]
MSLKAQNISSLPKQALSLELLPTEILLPIVTSISGLDTLWDLLRASPQVWRLFHSHTLAITEGILSGPNSILPPKIQELIRGVILARSEALPFRNLVEFRVQFLHGVIPFFQPKRATFATLRPELLSATMVPVAVLRSIVATAHQISALSQACLASCLQRLRDPSFRPLHAFDPEPYYTHGYGPNGDWVAAWDRQFIGTPAKVVDAGQPTWVEEMRVLRAMWIIQLVGEVHRLARHKTDTVGWPAHDVEMLNHMDPADLVDRPDGPPNKAEEVRAAMHYLATLGDASIDVYYRLPRPPSYSGSTRWITALPKRKEIIWNVWGFRRNGETHPLRNGSPVPEDSTPIKRPMLNDHYRWGQTEEALQRESSGMSNFRSLAISAANDSPIPGVKFDSFRPLGFAFWDQWRMHLLGLTFGIAGINHSPEFYFFAWESILSPDEVTSLKAELRKQGRTFHSSS